MLVLAWSVACTSDREPDASSEQPAASGSTSSSPSVDADIGPPAEKDWLAVRPAEEPRGPYALNGAWVIQAGDGSILVSYVRWPAEETRFRVYDRKWRPRTQLLQLDVDVTLERAFEDGFVGVASKTDRDGNYAYQSWISVSTAGEVREVAIQPTRGDAPQKMRVGDLRLPDSGRGRRAYRPTTDEVFTTAAPDWVSRRSSVYPSASGSVCSPERGRREGPIHATLADVAPWRTHDTGFIPTSDPSRRLFECSVHPERLVISTITENPTAVYTVDTDTGQLLSQHALGGRLDGYNTQTFPDGTLVTRTHAAGLMVGTDSTNAEMVFRPWPLPRHAAALWTLMGDTIVVAASRQELIVSTDHGRNWRTADLQMPPAG